jgi:hypothetical protein
MHRFVGHSVTSSPPRRMDDPQCPAKWLPRRPKRRTSSGRRPHSTRQFRAVAEQPNRGRIRLLSHRWFGACMVSGAPATVCARKWLLGNRRSRSALISADPCTSREQPGDLSPAPCENFLYSVKAPAPPARAAAAGGAGAPSSLRPDAWREPRSRKSTPPSTKRRQPRNSRILAALTSEPPTRRFRVCSPLPGIKASLRRLRRP